VDYSATDKHAIPLDIKVQIRNIFKNAIILSGAYNLENAETDIHSGLGDLIAFGRLFINNPDLFDRFKNNWPLSEKLNSDLFYGNDEKGYTDYPKFGINKFTSIYAVADQNIALKPEKTGMLNNISMNMSGKIQ
jgi:N-ethylmaleimide reductase